MREVNYEAHVTVVHSCGILITKYTWNLYSNTFIKLNSKLGQLIPATKLIIWEEALMAPSNNFLADGYKKRSFLLIKLLYSAEIKYRHYLYQGQL